MRNVQKVTEEILSIKEPNEAYRRVALAMDQDISLNEGEKIIEMYLEKYGISHDEMAFTPEGERVLNHQMFW